jgi:hypothetical protein
MGRITATIVLTAMLAGCASAALPPSRTVTALVALQLRARAGLYPGDWLVSGDSHAPQLTRLLAWADDEGVVVAYASIEKKHLLGHASFTLHAGWIVLLNDRMTVNMQLYILLHELAHVYGPSDLFDDQAEVVAMLVAAQVCEDAGLGVWPQTTAYLATRVPVERQTATVQRYAKQIDAVVLKLSGALK